MSEAGSRVRVQCTYPGCLRFFPSEREMKKHKTYAPDHEYCSRCDEDFEDENRLLIHKIKSERHIACPLCGLDFRSEGGRDAHVRQYHRADQNMVCVGCGVKYTRAAALMAHIEEGECPVITSKRLMQEQAKKLIIKELLRAGTDATPKLVIDPSNTDDINGGVKLIEARNREAVANQPKPKPGNDNKSSSSSSSSRKPTAPSVVSLKHWPRLGEVRPSRPDPSDLMEFSRLSLNDKEPDPSDLMSFSKLSLDDRKPDQKSADKHWPELGAQREPSDLMEFSTLSQNDPPETDQKNKADKGKGKAKADDTESIASDPRLPWEFEHTEGEANLPPRHPGGFGRGLPTAGETIAAFVPGWDPTRFFNSFTGVYDCPCGESFLEMGELEEHILKKGRSRGAMRCPACYRIFKSTAALIAHCESATTRCNVSARDDYAQIIDEISGGVIQYTGYHKDGTTKYEAGELQDLPEDEKERKTTTIGPDLSREPRREPKGVW